MLGLLASTAVAKSMKCDGEIFEDGKFVRDCGNKLWSNTNYTCKGRGCTKNGEAQTPPPVDNSKAKKIRKKKKGGPGGMANIFAQIKSMRKRKSKTKRSKPKVEAEVVIPDGYEKVSCNACNGRGFTEQKNILTAETEQYGCLKCEEKGFYIITKADSKDYRKLMVLASISPKKAEEDGYNLRSTPVDIFGVKYKNTKPVKYAYKMKGESEKVDTKKFANALKTGVSDDFEKSIMKWAKTAKVHQLTKKTLANRLSNPMNGNPKLIDHIDQIMSEADKLRNKQNGQQEDSLKSRPAPPQRRPSMRRKQSQLPSETPLSPMARHHSDAYWYWSRRTYSEHEKLRHSASLQDLIPHVNDAPFKLVSKDTLNLLLKAAVSTTPLRIPEGADVARAKPLPPKSRLMGADH